MSPCVLGVDFGGTKLAAAIVEIPIVPGDRLRRHDREVSPVTNDAIADRELMLDLCDRLLAGTRIAGVGVSFGGLVDPRTGRVVRSHHVSGWEGFPLKDWLEEVFQVPVAVDNDANAGAFGEWRVGASQGAGTSLYVTVSTGVGGGWIINGRIYRGRDGLAGEIGHVTIRRDGLMCTCGRRGCVEALASGQAIARVAAETIRANPTVVTALRKQLANETAELTAEEVAVAARAKDPIALDVMRGSARALGHGISVAVSLMNPDIVVLGGGVIRAGTWYIDEVRRSVEGSVLPGVSTTITAATLGDQAPLWGAAAMVEALLP